MAGSLDYFVEKFLMVKWVWDRVALKPKIGRASCRERV
jgi:hypothetical protein